MKQVLALFFGLLAVTTATQANDVINNDTFWKTTTGSYIYSQGGGIFRFPDAQGVEHYYWYGAKYQEAVDYCPKALAGSKSNITNFLGVTCYVSDDLVNWKYVRDVLTPSATGWAYWVGRMGVAYITEAKKYALLTQFNDHVLVATCSTPTGNYARHNEIDMTSMIGTPNTGDMTVFTDPDTGKSYLCYSYGKGRSKIYLSEIGVCSDGKIGLKDCHFFNADRVSIPSSNKPSQADLKGWKTTVIKGNKVVIGGADSPVLNASNSKEDRAVVTGNYCLNIQDKVDFTRKVSQTVKSTPVVELKDGRYTLKCYVKSGSQFNELYMYAKVGNETRRADMPYSDSKWHEVVIEDLQVSGGQVELGFYADGKANAWCHIDEVSLVRKGDTEDATGISQNLSTTTQHRCYYNLSARQLGHLLLQYFDYCLAKPFQPGRIQIQFHNRIAGLFA